MTTVDQEDARDEIVVRAQSQTTTTGQAEGHLVAIEITVIQTMTMTITAAHPDDQRKRAVEDPAHQSTVAVADTASDIVVHVHDRGLVSEMIVITAVTNRVDTRRKIRRIRRRNDTRVLRMDQVMKASHQNLHLMC